MIYKQSNKMKKHPFSEHLIFSTFSLQNKFDIDQILLEFNNQKKEFDYSHFIQKRWENIYVNPMKVPAILPFLSYVAATASKLYQQSLIIPHELLGFNKNEFWFNSAEAGESTRLHNHNSEATISGVFYLRVPEKSGNLFFQNGKNQELEFPAEKGKLVLFPAELNHYVPKNQSGAKRISLSFNCYKFPLSEIHFDNELSHSKFL